MINILSVDVEEWFHPEALQHLFPKEKWDEQESRVEQNINHLLDIFSEKDVKATFFILGWVAERHPGMIRRIVNEGHEIASHGNSHKMVTKMTPDEFKSDLQESIKILEDISGTKILGYRAPTFSIIKKTFWAREIMLELGLLYDSSVYPIWHDRYGVPDAPRSVHVGLKKNGSQLMEFSMPTIKWMKKNVPFGGGGYLRIFPLQFTKFAIKKFNKEGYPAIMYSHPWEFDADQPKLNLGMVQTKRHYFGINRNTKKLVNLFDTFKWTSFAIFIQNHLRSEFPHLKNHP